MLYIHGGQWGRHGDGNNEAKRGKFIGQEKEEAAAKAERLDRWHSMSKGKIWV